MHLALLWAFPFVPTQDGPVHLETTAILKKLLAGELFWSQIYTSNWSVSTNQLYHSLLLGLSYAVPLAVAERLVLSAYVLVFIGSTLACIRALGGRYEAALLLTPILFSLAFHTGLFNLCFGFLLFLPCLTLYQHYLEQQKRRYLVGLAALLGAAYLVHIIAGFVSVFSVGLMFLTWLGMSRLEGEGRPKYLQVALGTCLSLLPTAFLTLNFLGSRTQEPQVLTRFMSVRTMLLRFINADEVVANVARMLVAHSYLDLAVYLPWLALFALAAFWSGRRARPRPQNTLLAPTLALFLLAVVSPERLGEIGYVVNRLAPFSALGFILWLSLQDLGRLHWRSLSILALVLSAFTLLHVATLFSNYSATLSAYTEAADSLEPETFVLPFREPLRQRWQRVDPLHHAASYVTARRELVNLRNYQVRKGYFPVRIKEAYHPDIQVQPPGGERLENLPFAETNRLYRAATGCSLRYFLLQHYAELPASTDPFVLVYENDLVRVLENPQGAHCMLTPQARSK